jgi:hypothetical protein
MIWYAHVYDPDRLFDEQLMNEKIFDKIFYAHTYEEIITNVQATHHECDHFSLIYDGNWLLDGPANMSFWTVRYENPSILNHHTHSLLDYRTSLAYSPETIHELQTEIANAWILFFKEH